MNVSRRGVLASLGAAGVGLAGCLGNGENEHDCDVSEPDPVIELERPVLGSTDADVVVSSFDDFACPHCATFNLDVLPQVKSEYIENGNAQFHHYDFPIPVDEDWSAPVANAARGIQDRIDDETYYEYTTMLYEQQADGYSYEALGELAESVGGMRCNAIADAEFEPYESVVQADRAEGQQRGVSGTPTVFVDGQQVGPDFDSIAAAIESRL